MELTFACVDTSEAYRLFRRADWDAHALLRTLRENRLHLCITELVLVEMLTRGDTPARHERFRRIAEFADIAGPRWFSIGMNLGALRDSEFALLSRGDPSIRYEPNRLVDSFPALAASEQDFERWHAASILDTSKWLDADTWEQRDLKARQAALDEWQLDSIERRIEWLDAHIAAIPGRLAVNPVLEIQVKDPVFRARVAEALPRCRAYLALILTATMNGYGAMAAPEKHWHRWSQLRIEPNSYTDARILAEAAYADVVFSNDRGMKFRAEQMQSWGMYKPRVESWRS